MSFELARKIADAVLYEGYVLYPYRRSAVKNQFRWQFGVVAPRKWSEEGGEPWEMQTECLIEPHGSPVLDVTVRFLQVQGPESWEEGVERTIDPRGVSTAEPTDVPFSITGETPITGFVRLSAERIDGFVKFRVRIENSTEFEDQDRNAAMRRSLIGTHTLLSVSNGVFVSLTDPPQDARAAAAQCSNVHTWPVLVGKAPERDVLLSSPIILQDYPAIAPESQGDFCDATEIDELLTLRVMTLTDEEKREARATNGRAREIVERCDSIPPEMFERLHGAARSVEGFFNPPNEQPESAGIKVGGRSLSKGARVRLAPKRPADSMDLFLAGRTAVIEAVHHDVEDRVYVAVEVEGAGGGRYFYFYPDELELPGKET